jgi:hypothetical protein
LAGVIGIRKLKFQHALLNQLGKMALSQSDGVAIQHGGEFLAGPVTIFAQDQEGCLYQLSRRMRAGGNYGHRIA